MKKILLTATGLGAALASCASPTLEIREAKRPITEGELPTDARLAEGHAMMRLGNVGLAIESYRRALRRAPQDASAHAALANAYESMGRYDLSQRYYEKALAYAPHRPELYEALAASLARQGRPLEAAKVKAEAMARRGALEAQVAANGELAEVVAAEAMPAMPTPAPTSQVSVSLSATEIAYSDQVEAMPIIAPVAVGAVQAPTIDGQRTLAEVEAVASDDIGPILPAANVTAVDAPQLQAAPVTELAAIDADAIGTIRAPIEREAISAQQVDMAVASLVDDSLLPEMKIAAAPTISTPLKPQRIGRAEVGSFSAVKIATGPRLERTSASEVMLITRPDDVLPVAPRATRRAESAVTLLKTAPEQGAVRTLVADQRVARAHVEPAPVLLINASRRQGVAENARGLLAGHGYAELKIDTSPTGRARTILLYPRGQRAEAEKLARRFGFPVVFQVGPVEQMTLHLGRDAAHLFAEG
ncbi:tetratricopeptide repeat protein [Sphingomicrobium marinum]|uniref:tetratricopeptide repeat protein n=1 Tax=Sphingomicrobium marinum TaxID=1227950 RepID=UPI00223FD376|nr:tetratricopeptide repeat protein [Sphingomicrobium marinum]